jgi:hypothetical protein
MGLFTVIDDGTVLIALILLIEVGWSNYTAMEVASRVENRSPMP